MAAFFQSLKNIKMYAGNGGIAAQLVLEQRVFDTFYPQGIVSVRALVTCVAYRLDMSIAELGRQLRVPNFKEKLNSESRHRLQPDEIVKLRDYLAPQLKYMSHLGINMGLLDQLLPGPSEITQQSEAGFAQQLNDWARYATGTDIRSFAEQVSRYSGKSYVPQAVYQWGHGVGLAAALPFIVQALENNPHTRDDFLICRDRFIAAAEREIAPKSGLNISEKIRRAPTLGRALEAVETYGAIPLRPAQILERMRGHYGVTYSLGDYAGWKEGRLPSDRAFAGRLCEILVAHFQENGCWLTTEVRTHIVDLARGRSAAERDSWAGMLGQLAQSPVAPAKGRS